MKRSKLLTSLAALALVVSLGACSETEDDSTVTDDGDTTTSETETDSEGTSSESDDGSTSSGTEQDPTKDSNLETAKAILDAASNTQYIYWDALDATEYEDDEVGAKILLALDSSDRAYGYWYTYDDGDPDTFNYYVDGTKYFYEADDEEYYIADSGADLDIDTFLDDYGEILEDAADIDLEADETSYTLDGNTLAVTISEESTYAGITLTYQYKFAVDTSNTIVGLAYYGPDNELGLIYSGFTASETTYEAVASVMDTEFDITNWEEPAPKWSDYFSESNYSKATDLLGVTLDEILPVVMPEEGKYTSYIVSGTRVTLELYDDSGRSTPKYDYETLTYAWEDALSLAGWTSCTSTKGLEYVRWSYELDNYLALLQAYSEVSGVWNWDLHIYPSH